MGTVFVIAELFLVVLVVTLVLRVILKPIFKFYPNSWFEN